MLEIIYCAENEIRNIVLDLFKRPYNINIIPQFVGCNPIVSKVNDETVYHTVILRPR
jgi:hypothetical protein